MRKITLIFMVFMLAVFSWQTYSQNAKFLSSKGDENSLENITYEELVALGDAFDYTTLSSPTIICPLDIVVNNSSYPPNECGVQVFFNNATAFDPEDGLISVVQTMGPGTGSVFPVGETVIEFSATDSDGNTVTCQFTVTVIDDTPPVASCQDVTIALDNDGFATLNAADLDFGAGTLDPATPIQCDGTAGPTSAIDTNLINFSIVGANGTQIDFDNNCPGVTGLQDQTALEVSLIPGETYTVEATSWTCGASQFTAQTYVWIDFNGDGVLTSDEVVLTGAQESVTGGGPTGASPTGGNEFSNTFTVPEDAVLGNVIIRAMTQETAATPLNPCASFSWGSMIDFTARITLDGNPSTATCGSVSFAFSEDGTQTTMEFDCADIGENIVTLYVFNEDGTFSTCETTVTVIDDIAPVLVCAGGGVASLTSVTCSGNSGPTSPADTNLVSFTINGEDGTVIDYDFACGVTGLQNLTSNAVDLLPGETYTMELELWTCGLNQWTANANVWIDFNGNGVLEEDERILLGSQALVFGGGPTGANPTGGTTLEATFTVPADAYQGPVIIRTMAQETGVALLDPCASYSWGTMADFVANIINPNAGAIPQYFLDADGQVAVPVDDLYDSVTDNCSVTVSVLAGPEFEVCTSSNASNNFENGYSNLAAINRVVANDILVEANESFTLQSIEFNQFTSPGVEVLAVDVYYYNSAGNLPGAQIGSEVNLTPVSQPVVGGNFGFDARTVTLDVTPFEFSAPAASAATFWVGLSVLTSDGGNTFMEVTTESIVNNPAAVNDGSGSFVLQPGDGVYSFSGICGNAGGPAQEAVFTCADIGIVDVVVVATDASGNTTSCVTQIEIVDDIVPEIVALEDVTVEIGADGTVCITPEDVATFTDNCGVEEATLDISCFSCADLGTTVDVELTVVDASGNSAVEVIEVTIVDAEGPVIECPGDMVVDTNQNSLTYTLPNYFATGLVGVSDNCSTGADLILTQDPAPGVFLMDGVYTITLTAEDASGNLTVCEFELTVETVLGVDDNILADAVVMYPNPADAYVMLTNSSQIELTQATIYDISGKLIATHNLSLSNGEQRLDVSNLASGVYLINIQSENASVVKRLVKR